MGGGAGATTAPEEDASMCMRLAQERQGVGLAAKLACLNKISAQSFIHALVPELLNLQASSCPRFCRYALLGLEQTAESTRLDNYDWPRRAVLLLGAEKEGIPATLLSLLDGTLEIPQAGVVRSLNVHVAGALALYAYVSQHLRRGLGPCSFNQAP